MPPHEGMGGRSPLGAGMGIERMVPDPSPPGEPKVPRVKCVLVGDGAIGKTSLIVSYTTNGYPTEYVPTAFDNYAVLVTVDNKPIRLQLCDTAGQDDFDELRPLCYPNTDVFLLCFSVVSPTSFHNIRDKWLPEIRKYDPRAPMILVGTQSDLRNDVKVLIELANYNEAPIAEADAERCAADIGATYVECSALTQKNLKEVFDNAILVSLTKKGMIEKRGKASKRAKKYKCKSEMWTVAQGSPSLHGDRSDSAKSKGKKGWKKFCCFV